MASCLLLRRVTDKLRAVLLCDVVMNGISLRDFEVSVDDVRKIGEVHDRALITLPLSHLLRDLI